MSDVLGEITIKQNADGYWSYNFKNIKGHEVISHLEEMKYLILQERFGKKKKKKQA